MYRETEPQFDQKTILKIDEAQKPKCVQKEKFQKVITELRFQQKAMD